MPSSVISHFHYNEKLQTLTIVFVTEMVYRYQNVPKEVYQKLKISGSKGRYFNHFIKDKFDFVKES